MIARKLNVGCGTDYRMGWINLDFNKKFKADVYYDLNNIYSGRRLPFKDNYFNLIILYDVLEHFPEPLSILRELYRICKKGGIIEIKVPNGSWVWDNLDHKHQFFINSFNVINFDDYCSGGEKKVELIYKKLYVLPSKNLLFKIIRFFFKNNAYVKYRKVV